MENILKIGFGGGCHWCTEAVFRSLKGVVKVEQGFIAPKENLEQPSEAVIVHFNENDIGLKDLLKIHLYTHKSTKNHSMRNKYRSAVYFFEKQQKISLKTYMQEIQSVFKAPLITQILPFGVFNPSKEKYQDYYYSDITKPFCETHISPKVALLIDTFPQHVRDSLFEMES